MRKFWFLIACVFLSLGVINGWAESGTATQDAEGEASVNCQQAVERKNNWLVLPLDSIPPPRKKIEKPTYESPGGLFTLFIGIIAWFSGYFNPIGILIAGGIFALLGVGLLIAYLKLKDVNPFRLKGKNALAKILLAFFFFIFLIALIGSVIMAFAVALALLVAAIASTVVSPAVVAGVIMGLGVLWLFGSWIAYLIKRGRYKKMLRNE